MFSYLGGKDRLSYRLATFLTKIYYLGKPQINLEPPSLNRTHIIIPSVQNQSFAPSYTAIKQSIVIVLLIKTLLKKILKNKLINIAIEYPLNNYYHY